MPLRKVLIYDLLFFHSVPGCKEKWKAQSDYCFQVITNDSFTNEKMSGHCRENGGKSVYATDKRSVHLVEQLLSLMQLNSETNSSRCVVIGDKNASSFSTLPRSSKPVLSSATHACAVTETDKWKIQSCNATNCYHLCITPRGRVFTWLIQKRNKKIINKQTKTITERKIRWYFIENNAMTH